VDPGVFGSKSGVGGGTHGPMAECSGGAGGAMGCRISRKRTVSGAGGEVTGDSG
jgi:hypothetical protein